MAEHIIGKHLHCGFYFERGTRTMLPAFRVDSVEQKTP